MEVVVVDLLVVAGSVATALALDLSSPHEAMTNRAAQPTAIALRRIATVCQRDSALQHCRRRLLAGADARRDADAVVAGACRADSRGKGSFDRRNCRAVMGPVLRERHVASG